MTSNSGANAGRLLLRRPRGNRAVRGNLLVTSVILTLLIALPLGFLSFGAFRSGPPGTEAGFTLENFRYLGSSEFFALLSRSLGIATGATLISIVGGAVLAGLAVRVRLYGGRFLQGLIVVPAYITPFIGALAWTLLLSPQIGYLNAVFDAVGIPRVSIYSHFGIVWVMGIYFAPIVYLYFRPAMLNLDRSLEESARVLGASPRVVWRRIVVPLLLPPLLSSTLIVFVSAIGQFAVPGVLGPPARIEVIPTQIVRMTTQFPSDPNGAAVLGLALLALTVGGLWLSNRALNRRDFVTMGARSAPAPRIDRTSVRLVGSSIAWGYVLLTVVVPLAVMVLASFQPFLTTDPNRIEFTLANYEYVFAFPKIARSLSNSVQLAVSAAVICGILSIFIGHLVVRGRIRGRFYVDQLSNSSIAIPHTVFGLAMLWTWVTLQVGIYGTKWILLIAYVALLLPFCVRPVVAAFRQIDVALEESGRVMGASWRVVLFRIVAPLVAPAVISGSLIVLYHAIRELAASVMLYTVGSEVISVMIWELYGEGSYVQLFALGTVLVAINLVLVAIARAMTTRFERHLTT